MGNWLQLMTSLEKMYFVNENNNDWFPHVSDFDYIFFFKEKNRKLKQKMNVFLCLNVWVYIKHLFSPKKIFNAAQKGDIINHVKNNKKYFQVKYIFFIELFFSIVNRWRSLASVAQKNNNTGEPEKQIFHQRRLFSIFVYKTV